MSDHEQNVSQDTMMFRAGSEGNHVAALTIATVCQALKEKGYNLTLNEQQQQVVDTISGMIRKKLGK